MTTTSAATTSIATAVLKAFDYGYASPANRTKYDAALSFSLDSILSSTSIVEKIAPLGDVKPDQTLLSESDAKLVQGVREADALASVFVRALDGAQDGPAPKIAERCLKDCGGVEAIFATVSSLRPDKADAEVNNLLLSQLSSLCTAGFLLSVYAQQHAGTNVNAETCCELLQGLLESVSEECRNVHAQPLLASVTLALCSMPLPPTFVPKLLLSAPFRGTVTDWVLAHHLPQLLTAINDDAKELNSFFEEAATVVRQSTQLSELQQHVMPVRGYDANPAAMGILERVLLHYSCFARAEFWSMHEDIELYHVCKALYRFSDSWQQAPEGWLQLHHVLQSRGIQSEVRHAAYSYWLAALPVTLESLLELVQQDFTAMDIREEQPFWFLLAHWTTDAPEELLASSLALLRFLARRCGEPAVLQQLIGSGSLPTNIVGSCITASSVEVVTCAANFMEDSSPFVDVALIIQHIVQLPNMHMAPLYATIRHHIDLAPKEALAAILVDCPSPSSSRSAFVEWVYLANAILGDIEFPSPPLAGASNDDILRALSSAIASLDELHSAVLRQEPLVFSERGYGGAKTDVIVRGISGYLSAIAVQRSADLIIIAKSPGVAPEPGTAVVLVLIEMLFSLTKISSVEAVASLLLYLHNAKPNESYQVVRTTARMERRTALCRCVLNKLSRSSFPPVNICRLAALETIARRDPQLFHYLLKGESEQEYATQVRVFEEIARSESSESPEKAAALRLLTVLKETNIEPAKLFSDLHSFAGAYSHLDQCQVMSAALEYSVQWCLGKRQTEVPNCCFEDANENGMLRSIRDAIEGPKGLLEKMKTLRSRVVDRRRDCPAPKLEPILLGNTYIFTGNEHTAANMLYSSYAALIHTAQAVEAMMLWYADRDVSNHTFVLSMEDTLTLLLRVAASTDPITDMPSTIPRRLFETALRAASATAEAAREHKGGLLGLSVSNAEVSAAQKHALALLDSYTEPASISACLRAVAASRYFSTPDVGPAACAAVVRALEQCPTDDSVWLAAIIAASAFLSSASRTVSMKLVHVCWEQVQAALGTIDLAGPVTFQNRILADASELLCLCIANGRDGSQHVPQDFIQALQKFGAVDHESIAIEETRVYRRAWHGVWCSLLRIACKLLMHGGPQWPGLLANFIRSSPRVLSTLTHPFRQDPHGRIYPFDVIEAANVTSLVSVCHLRHHAILEILPSLRKTFHAISNFRYDRVKEGIRNAGDVLMLSAHDADLVPAGVENLVVPMARDVIASLMCFPPEESNHQLVVDIADPSAPITFETLRDFIMQELGLIIRIKAREGRVADDPVQSSSGNNKSPRSPSLSHTMGGAAFDREGSVCETEMLVHAEAVETHMTALEGALELYVEHLQHYSGVTLHHKQQSALNDSREQLVAVLAKANKIANDDPIMAAVVKRVQQLIA